MNEIKTTVVADKNVFVYGSLREKLGNHGWLYQDKKNEPVRYVPNADKETFTIKGFDMYPMTDQFPFNYPICTEGEGSIEVEIYKVSPVVCAYLDALEGYSPLYKGIEALELAETDRKRLFPDNITCKATSLYDRKEITTEEGITGVIYFQHPFQTQRFELDKMTPIDHGDWKKFMVDSLTAYVEEIK